MAAKGFDCTNVLSLQSCWVFEVERCPVYGCTNTRIEIPVHIGCCETAAEELHHNQVSPKQALTQIHFLLSCTLDLLYATGHKKGNLSINTRSFHFPLCCWLTKPLHTMPIRQRGWICSREKVSLGPMA